MDARAADPAVEFFPALRDLADVRHAFIGRIPGIDVATDRAEALARLDAAHRALRANLGFVGGAFATAEQVHGNTIGILDEPLRTDQCLHGADGLVTNQEGVSLGIYVADCCAIFLVDPVRRCIGLVHSGKKGTALAIVSRAIRQMGERFGSVAHDLVVQLSPCIRPPHYEIDFAAEIIRQARAAGVEEVRDSGRCTACEPRRYYSYRAEKARTGRMLALLALK
ncbi:MAG TPA: polyphenol oxidase family protein [Chthoniobacterales bacterium]|jgi:copper oxidase (laccase) domain-containing protein|nr:polyphenol oxidase family protein [Chthoniobacterales bacterium]